MSAQRSPRPASAPEPGDRAGAVIIPIKAFGDAKGRLAERFAPHERRALAVAMAEGVIAAADGLDVYVVADDPEVARWAAGIGAEVVDPGGPGLDRAAVAGLRAARGDGHRRVVVSHADLPLAERLNGVDAGSGVTLVTDRHGDGTNVIVVPTDAGFRFSYGPGSRQRHTAEAERIGLPVTLVDDGPLCWDVDVPDDVAGPVAELLARTIDRAAHG